MMRHKQSIQLIDLSLLLLFCSCCVYFLFQSFQTEHLVDEANCRPLLVAFHNAPLNRLNRLNRLPAPHWPTVWFQPASSCNSSHFNPLLSPGGAEQPPSCSFVPRQISDDAGGGNPLRVLGGQQEDVFRMGQLHARPPTQRVRRDS